MNDRSAALVGRYEELSVLGRGGAGTVYLVRDRETGDRLALKRLLNADAESLLRLKREFRALADISHPNLVKLFELGQDATSAYFTMEFLEGADLLQHLAMNALTTTAELPSLRAPAINDNASADARRAHVARVLGVFEQLATGVRALHTTGLLHRDLKPSNVMVSQGRVVVLDFGIALDVGLGDATVTQDKLGVGTPAYMAPEQVYGSHLGEANDWYAVGAMLYEALSGVLPIEGTTLAELFERKRTRLPRDIRELIPGLPDEVASLCMRLLRPEPKERPSGEQVLQALHACTGRASTVSNEMDPSLTPLSRTHSDNDLSLFGRESELAALSTAFRTAQEGGSSAVHVFGESGAGKSQLLHHFSDEVAHGGDAANGHQPLVLRSRCYERETLAFKALDAAIDTLVSELSRESDVRVSYAMPPRNLLALTQLFPSLRSLRVTRQLLAQEKLPVAVSQTRAQAEVALSDLLTRLCQQRPVLLWFDDLQWGDLDSIGIISGWLKPPHIPGLMLVFSYRSEEIATSPALRMLSQSPSADIELKIPLPLLGEEHVRALCTQRFERAQWPAAARARVIDRIVVEAEGSPFLASQLASLAIAQPNTSDEQLARLTLEDLIRSRSQSLSDGAHRMLNVLSMAGRPISLALAARAANVVQDARACVHELQSLHLIRSRDAAGERLLEVYHDRLREVVVSLLAPEARAAIDRSLLTSLREAGSTDDDWLHALALALDEREDALRYGMQAAARASEKLAFERAAELYSQCVELSPDPSASDGALWQKLAQSYSYAGHGSKAANTYLRAAQQVNAEQRLRFERAAASQLICCGRFDEGEALLESVLERLGSSAPRSEVGLYAAVGWERTRLWLRGQSYVARPRSEQPFALYFKAEFCGVVSIETASYHPLRAALFQARCLRLALSFGDHEDVARALCAAATITSVEASERAQLTAEEMLARAEAIERKIDSSLLRTNIASARAMCAYLAGRLADSVELCAQAEQLLRVAGAEAEYHHRFTLGAARIGALMDLHQTERAKAELDIYIREADATENINAKLHVCYIQTWHDLLSDRAHAAMERLDCQRKQLPRVGFGMLHVLHMAAVLRTGCATGEFDWALESTSEHWQTFQSSVVRRSEIFCVYGYATHARLLLCRAARHGQHADLQRELSTHRAALKKVKLCNGRGELQRIDARIAIASGDRGTAQQLLNASIVSFESAGAPDHAERDRFALGALQGDAAGKSLQQAAVRRLRELGIVAPLRDLRGYYPELLDDADDSV